MPLKTELKWGTTEHLENSDLEHRIFLDEAEEIFQSVELFWDLDRIQFSVIAIYKACHSDGIFSAQAKLINSEKDFEIKR